MLASARAGSCSSDLPRLPERDPSTSASHRSSRPPDPVDPDATTCAARGRRRDAGRYADFDCPDCVQAVPSSGSWCRRTARPFATSPAPPARRRTAREMAAEAARSRARWKSGRFIPAVDGSDVFATPTSSATPPRSDWTPRVERDLDAGATRCMSPRRGRAPSWWCAHADVFINGRRHGRSYDGAALRASRPGGVTAARFRAAHLTGCRLRRAAGVALGRCRGVEKPTAGVCFVRRRSRLHRCPVGRRPPLPRVRRQFTARGRRSGHGSRPARKVGTGPARCAVTVSGDRPRCWLVKTS